MVKSLRLAWLKRIFKGTKGTWKSYLQQILSSVAGLFFLNCNYNISDYTNPSQFLSGTIVMVVAISWNVCHWRRLKSHNLGYKEIKVENKPVYYKHYASSRVICIQDLLFSLNCTDIYNQLFKKICKTNIFEWAGSREVHSPIAKKLWQVSLHNLTNICSGWQHFWCYEKEIKGLLHPTHQRKSQTTQFVQKLKSNFYLNSDHLKQIFKLPNSIVVELYVRTFQYKVINSILYTDTKLF